MAARTVFAALTHVRCVLAACLLVSAACTSSGVVGPTVPLNQRFTLAVGESATIDRTAVRLGFVGVTGDSRCTADAVCIQGGDALVHVRVTDRGATSAYELHTGDGQRAQVLHGSLRIQLVELQPYPFSGRPTAPGDYRATFTASGP